MNVMTDTGMRAVTICRGTRRVDVRLPAAVPVAELMPGLLDLLDGEEPSLAPAASGSPRTWELVPLGRPPLDWGHTLTDARVADGDMLFLAEEQTAATGAAIYDVADLTADRMELAGSRFGLGHAVVAWSGCVALAGIGVTAIPAVGIEVHPWALTVAAVLLVGAVVVGRFRPLPASLMAQVVAHAVPAAAICCAVMATAGWLDGRSAAAIAGGAGAVGFSLGLAAFLATEQRLVGAAAAVGGLAVGLAAGLDAATLSATQTALVVGGLAFLAIGAAPHVAVTAGGMRGLDQMIRSGGSPDQQAVTTAVTRSDQVLTGSLAACAVMTGTAATVLAAGTAAALVAAVLLTVGLLVRAQSFTRPVHRVVVRLPALVAAAVLPAVAGVAAEFVVVAVVAVPLAVFGALLYRWPQDVVATLRLVTGWLEVALVVAIAPVAAAAAGLFAWLSETL